MYADKRTDYLVFEGCTVIEDSEERIVQRGYFGSNGNGVITHIFPRKYSPEEKESAFRDIGEILSEAYKRILIKEEKEAESRAAEGETGNMQA